jgi:subtilase family serine protease
MQPAGTFTSPANAPGAGSTFTISFTLRNPDNNDNAGAFLVKFYYATSTATTNLTQLEPTASSTVAFTGLTAKTNSAPQTITVRLPATGVQCGTGYIHYFIDSENAVAESDETNNRGYNPIQIDPDLQVSTLTINPTTQIPGQPVTATYQVKNAGACPANNFLLRFYYSADNLITTTDTYLNQEVTVTSLAAGATSTSATVNVTVPAAAQTGSRYIGAIVDYNTLVTESNETNNTASAALTVVGSTTPDLVMGSWSATATSTGSGATFPITYVVQNTGGVAAGAFVVRFYYGDSTSTTNLTQLGTDVAFASLAATASTTPQTFNVTLPANVLNGTRYLHYFIDAAAAVTEGDENNNRASRTISITGQPDLHVNTLTLNPTTSAAGGSVVVTYRLDNLGVTRADNFVLRFYFSNDVTIATTDTYLNQEVTVTSLDAAANYPAAAAGTVTVTIPTPATFGTFYVGAIVDYNTQVTESNETNNTLGAALLIPGTNGTACTSATQCATGFCVDGFCCNTACGNGATTDCQACSIAAGAAANGTCVNLPSTHACRAAAGPCDAVETCTGTSAICPTDVYLAAGTTCRASNGACDVAETCSGTTITCPTDAFAAAGTACRAVAGSCDVAETCLGSSAACPVDAFLTAGTVCRAAAGVCDEVETCSGTVATCPTDVFKAVTVVCRTAAGECDVAENCSSIAALCPTNSYKQNGLACTGGTCLNGICSSTAQHDGGHKEAGPKEAGPKLDAKQEAGANVEAGTQHEAGPADGLKVTADGKKAGDGVPPGDGGCSCHVAASPSSSLLVCLCLLALLFVSRRRR